MTFGTIFWPVFAAFGAIFAIKEIIYFVLGLYFRRKQEKLHAEMEAKIASGEINPMEMLLGGGGMPGMQGMGPPGSEVPQLTTASGEETKGHGTYL